eukprot:7446695-Karenia_brevis.AAC.1
MSTQGDLGPPNSPLGSEKGEGEDQYGTNMVAEQDEKMVKLVATVVKQMMGEMLPHLIKSQQGPAKTVDDKKGKLEE